MSLLQCSFWPPPIRLFSLFSSGSLCVYVHSSFCHFSSFFIRQDSKRFFLNQSQIEDYTPEKQPRMATALEPKEQKGLLIVEAEDHSWGQDSISQKCYLHRRELFRQHFRKLCYQDAPGPRDALTRLWKLCRQWLRPECNTKEQILDLLVLEQFLSILPRDLQTWMQAHHPETGEEAVSVLEDLERELEPQKQVRKEAVIWVWEISVYGPNQSKGILSIWKAKISEKLQEGK